MGDVLLKVTKTMLKIIRNPTFLSRRLQLSTIVKHEEKTHFGSKTVGVSEKQDLVNEVFTNVADTYDKMNDAMSLGVHRCWKDWFVQELSPRNNTKMLDMAGGTGDIAFRAQLNAREAFGSKKSNLDITVADINADMLRVGEQRAIENKDINEKFIKFEVADAHNLQFDDNSFDYYTISFGIRNCTELDKVLDEAYRVLKPGGRFLCLEFSPGVNPLLKPLYDAWSFHVIPPLGQVLANDWDSYQYFVESIRKFPPQEEFKMMIEGAGFDEVHFQNYSLGICSLHQGFKL